MPLRYRCHAAFSAMPRRYAIAMPLLCCHYYAITMLPCRHCCYALRYAEMLLLRYIRCCCAIRAAASYACCHAADIFADAADTLR